jgi:hypothetical protein
MVSLVATEGVPIEGNRRYESYQRGEGVKRIMSGDVKRFFDPKLFEWKRGENGRYRKEMTIRITPKGQISLSKKAADKIKEVAEPSEEGFYVAEIGIAKKAIAVRPIHPEKLGYRFRWAKGLLVCTSTTLVSELKWELPLKAIAVWDDKNNMLVAKIEG